MSAFTKSVAPSNIQLFATAIYCANFCRQAKSNFSVAPVIIAIIYNCNLQKLLRIFFDWTVIFYKMFILRLHQLIDIYRIQNCIFKRPIIQEVNIYCLTTNNFQCYITPCSWGCWHCWQDAATTQFVQFFAINLQS